MAIRSHELRFLLGVSWSQCVSIMLAICQSRLAHELIHCTLSMLVWRVNSAACSHFSAAPVCHRSWSLGKRIATEVWFRNDRTWPVVMYPVYGTIFALGWGGVRHHTCHRFHACAVVAIALMCVWPTSLLSITDRRSIPSRSWRWLGPGTRLRHLPHRGTLSFSTLVVA